MIRDCADASLGVVAIAVVLALPSTALAQSEGRLSADVSATAGYSNNPFTIEGGDTGSAVVSIDVAPRYQRLTQRGTITVSADANLQQYLRRYGRNDSYSGALDYQGQPGERVNTHARLDLSSAVLGALDGYAPITTGTDAIAVTGIAGAATAVTTTPLTTIAPVSTLVPLADVGLFGLRNRRRSARLGGDIGIGLSARDTLTVSGYGELARYANLTAGNYNAYGGSVGYTRRVSDHVTAGLQGAAALYDYQTGIANNRVYSIQATGSVRLSELWSADGALGVSFINGDSEVSTGNTSLSGNIDLCHRGQLSTMCAQASRQVEPTGLAGSEYVTTASLNWTKRLGERDNASVGASYSSVSGGNTRLVLGSLPLQTQYAQVMAGYNRQLRERLRLVASVDYRQLLGGGNAGRPKDFGGQIGLAYRLGDKR